MDLIWFLRWHAVGRAPRLIENKADKVDWKRSLTASLLWRAGFGGNYFSKEIGRDDKIRTCDFTHPKGALYQAEPRPDLLQCAGFEA